MTSRSKKPPKIKKFGSKDEVDGVCDFIREHLHYTLDLFQDKGQIQRISRFHQDFFTILQTIQTFYLELNSDCQKNITSCLSKIHENLKEYIKTKTDKKLKQKLLDQILKEVSTVSRVITSCIGRKRQTFQDTRSDDEKVREVLAILLRQMETIVQEELVMRNISTTKNSNVSLRIIFLKNDPYYLSTLKRGTLFSIMKNFSNHIHDIFTSIPVNDEIKDYIFSLLRIWKSNVKEGARVGANQEQVSANCALVILKRILLACFLFIEGQANTMYMKYIDKLEPSLSDLEGILKKAYEIPQQQRKSTDLIKKIRSRWQKEKVRKSIEIPSIQKQQKVSIIQKEKSLTSQLSRDQYQKSVNLSLLKLEQEVRKVQEQPIGTVVQQQIKIQSQQPRQFQFEYESPGFHHRQTVQDQLLRQRKQRNIPAVQKSLVNLPHQIMETAIKGKYSGIFLVDAANQLRQFSSQKQIRSNLRRLIPVDVIATARWKPLFVLVEQTDLDQSTIPKATLDNRDLNSGILRVKVSCVKQTHDGRRIDCYKKQTGQQFTKNPMDDFVLLTLQYALRSYYYKYMRHIGKNVNLLKNLETFRELVSNNPYQVLLQQQQLDDIVRQSYAKVRFDDNVPFTWLISNDQWRDWVRSKN